MLSGCGPGDRLRDPSDLADAIASAGGLQRVSVRAGDFSLRGYARSLDADESLLVVYIEGDGAAWRSRNRPPADPTPTNPVALRLAAQEPSSAVLYLARPCQYGLQPRCEPALWSSARFAPRVVAAFDRALDAIQAAARGRRLALVGWSGGGTLAALLAARRDDVAWLLTVASPLDLARWTGFHGLTPLHASLDPAGARARIAAVPQLHLAGAEDEVVPPALVADFVASLGPGAPAALRILDGADHQCCWAERWRALRDRWPMPAPAPGPLLP